ncbi:hypothetical protein [Daejeonella lutea]|uniref:Uncharacterized protein n=1 Tax=Daejeonella lutea TaxID=572036 RepID=A0A1T5EAS6_9SPHI|nr:hypothetical protein [Daejeonella lutea]SKB80953.1 hypothetical protein SAMN05661099_2835 [Daejeonella lutea]
MTFENHTRGEFHEQNQSKSDAKAVKTEDKKADAEVVKDDLELSQGKKTGHPNETVGYVGGQPTDDERGLDVSQYTGPGSKPSSEFKDPAAPYHQGPGSGLSQQEKADETDWENPEPENDSF